MRTREVIERKSADVLLFADAVPATRSIAALQLEVLLDIRDLLGELHGQLNVIYIELANWRRK